ncbi:MAG: hypothetical protein KA210_14080 [Bacteroidia bacterium]|nr:hypothetical protein [Bacteroidia bacterium]
MKSFLGVIYFTILYLTLFLSYGLGIYHSFKKHSTAEGVISIVAIPFGMYRGFEYFWHNNFEGVNWDKKIKNDTEICIYLLETKNEKNVNLYELNENIEKFVKKINEYPDDKKDILRNNIKQYLKFTLSLNNDLYIFIQKYNTNEQFIFKMSDKTEKYFQELKNNIYINSTQKYNPEKFITNMNKPTKRGERINRKELNLYKEILMHLEKNYKNTFKVIFDENYNNHYMNS